MLSEKIRNYRQALETSCALSEGNISFTGDMAERFFSRLKDFEDMAQAMEQNGGYAHQKDHSQDDDSNVISLFKARNNHNQKQKEGAV